MNEIDYLKKYYNGNIDEAIKRLNSGEPVQYIVGNVDFYGSEFKVNKNVLIPRFETEQLVEKTIDYISEFFDRTVDIVDIGTGSGCIAITLKKQLDCNMDAVDISYEALNVAKQNSINLNSEVNFIEGNLLEPLTKKYDVIISNPPYIAKDDKEIMDIVKTNEPHIALFADNNGLECYEKILSDAARCLKDRSIIAFEIGYMQANSIKKFVNKYFPNSIVKVEKDLQNKDRFIFIFNGM